MKNIQIQPGQPHPEGATCRDGGVNFALHAPQAEHVELCLFVDDHEHRLPLTRSGDIWHGFIADLGAGTHYGYRVHGPSDPAHGLIFNPQKLLLDPYAKTIAGKPDLSTPAAAQRFHWQNDSDNAAHAPKSVVTAPAGFAWGDDHPPRTPWENTILYEAHVKGFTQKHPRIPASIAGTFAGMAHPEAIRHLKRLGVTAVELLPISYAIDEAHLQQRGLKNYWGYNVLGHFSVNPDLAADKTAPLDEFKTLVRTLHRVGIEVILDVVFNHTAEGERQDAMLCQRGIANPDYYWLHHSREENWSGCGNAINASHPHTLKWILDALRYWVEECHVDGFRFDLGSILGRTPAFTRDAPFFAAIAADPLLSQVKLIAEPWDIGWGGYQLGQFPPPFAEWNDRFRDDMRRHFLWQNGESDTFARRFAGSDDHFAEPWRSINFISAHDGFTLRDLVSYNDKHNHANGEDNCDGHSDNFSDNHGHEGRTDDAAILAARHASQRSLLAALLLSHGTPMLLAGDEFGNSQHGNNNSYCQDNPIAWLDWANADHELLRHAEQLIRLRKRIPLLATKRRWTDADVQWLTADGKPMQVEDWHARDSKALQILMQDAFLILVNSKRSGERFTLPPGQWQDCLHSGQYQTTLQTTHMDIRVLERLEHASTLGEPQA
ncbi:MAG: glycogen debranching protein GlgX [Cardiobacteriaceae bacterium]|nr:glycogen debranching protein GlgX [Cardiobacteriaceae bacterium]